MIRSMTGFAREERHGDWGKLTWELRAVNHRYLDITLRLSEDFRPAEPGYRETIAKVISRGKLDCTLRFEPSQAITADLSINEPLLERLVHSATEIATRIRRAAPLSIIELMRWPGVIAEPERDLEPVGAAAAEALVSAVSRLGRAREREGARLKEMLLKRGEQLEALVREVRSRLPEVRARIRERITERLDELDAEPDENRLEQELVLLAQKMDVDEELDRLASHIQEVRAIVERSEPVGRRLDFLMQELNREANTLSAKSQDIVTTRAAVDMKVLIEQMREQNQNIE